MKFRTLLILALLSLPFSFLLLSGCSDRDKEKMIDLSDVISNEDARALAARENGSVLWFGFDLRSSPQEDAKQYLPFLKYLEASTGYRFELAFIPRSENVVETLGKAKVQFAAIGAGTYLHARAKHGVIPLARGLSAEGGAQYRSVIVVEPDGPIRSIADLRNRRFAFGSVTSTQGHLIPRIVLFMNGITLKDLRSYDYTGSHQNCATAVLAGRADACGMQDTMGQELAHAGLVRILYTSKRYPTSGIAANRHVSPEILARVKQALLEFEPQGRHAQGLYHWEKTEMPQGFVEARDSDYAELREWARKLGYFSEGRP